MLIILYRISMPEALRSTASSLQHLYRIELVKNSNSLSNRETSRLVLTSLHVNQENVAKTSLSRGPNPRDFVEEIQTPILKESIKREGRGAPPPSAEPSL